MRSYKYLKKNLYNFSCDIFPYHRSLASAGTLETLKYLKNSNSSLKLLKTKSRKKVFDWIIPDEWNLKQAYIIDLKTGKKVLDYKNNNLHIVQYSIAINKKFSFDELKKNFILINQSLMQYLT